MPVPIMMTDSVLPNWPPGDGTKIGEERAREYVAWIRYHAPPLVAEGRRVLQARFGVAECGTSSARVDQLAEWGLDERMDALNVGVVYCSIQSGSWAMMDISIRRDGRLELKPGWNMG